MFWGLSTPENSHVNQCTWQPSEATLTRLRPLVHLAWHCPCCLAVALQGFLTGVFSSSMWWKILYFPHVLNSSIPSLVNDLWSDSASFKKMFLYFLAASCCSGHYSRMFPWGGLNSVPCRKAMRQTDHFCGLLCLHCLEAAQAIDSGHAPCRDWHHQHIWHSKSIGPGQGVDGRVQVLVSHPTGWIHDIITLGVF